MLTMFIFCLSFSVVMLVVFIEIIDGDYHPVVKRKYNQWDHIKQIEDEVEDDGD